MLMVAEFGTILFCTTVSVTGEERDYLHPFSIVSHVVSKWVFRAEDIVVVQIEFSRCHIELLGTYGRVILVLVPEE